MKLLSVIIAILMVNQVNAQPIHITGDIQNVEQDSISIKLYPYFSFYWQTDNASRYDAGTEKGKFKFGSELMSRHSYISLYFNSKENYRRPLRLFLTVPGDSIHIVVSDDSIRFSGKGAAKFICQYKMQQVPEIGYSPKELAAFDNNIASYAFNMFSKKRADSLCAVKLQILEEYRSKVPDHVYQQLKINCITANLFDQCKYMNLRYDSLEDPLVRRDKIRFFRELQKEPLPDNLDGTLLAQSSSACDYLLCKTILSLRLNRYSHCETAEEFNEPKRIAALVSGQLKGLIKEKILALSFYLYYKPQKKNDEKEMVQALNECTNPYFHKFLVSLQNAREPGRDAYPFELISAKDEKIRLTDFKGKVVVLDFWFTGCSYCTRLEKRMKNIRSKFINDSNVVFISICADINKNLFLRSVSTGKYCDKDEINLYTGEIAFDHPLLKHYKIIGCPEIVIIDGNQKTFNSKPVRPVDEVTDNNFMNLVLKAKSLGN